MTDTKRLDWLIANKAIPMLALQKGWFIYFYDSPRPISCHATAREAIDASACPKKKKLTADQRAMLRRRIARNSKNHGASFREANLVMAATKKPGIPFVEPGNG
tara:strand:+ start:79 stop:390 length:312 start_codon:yes stop_codon:yes gene_type:complete